MAFYPSFILYVRLPESPWKLLCASIHLLFLSLPRSPTCISCLAIDHSAFIHQPQQYTFTLWKISHNTLGSILLNFWWMISTKHFWKCVCVLVEHRCVPWCMCVWYLWVSVLSLHIVWDRVSCLSFRLMAFDGPWLLLSPAPMSP